MTAREIADKIRQGELDCNSSELFFGALIKALMVDLRSAMTVRDIPVPHMIINTGDDLMWSIAKGYDHSIEPIDISNENHIYHEVPRCVVSPGSIDMVPDQLTSPYTDGVFQYEHEDSLYTFHAEFRRMPVKLQVNLKYILDAFTDVLELTQHICTKLAFVRTFRFVYMGQTILASYKIPESVEDQHMTEITGDTQDERNRSVELSVEVESYIPVYAPRTVVPGTYIAYPVTNTTLNPESTSHETVIRNAATRSGYRGPGKR